MDNLAALLARAHNHCIKRVRPATNDINSFFLSIFGEVVHPHGTEGAKAGE